MQEYPWLDPTASDEYFERWMVGANVYEEDLSHEVTLDARWLFESLIAFRVPKGAQEVRTYSPNICVKSYTSIQLATSKSILKNEAAFWTSICRDARETGFDFDTDDPHDTAECSSVLAMAFHRISKPFKKVREDPVCRALEDIMELAFSAREAAQLDVESVDLSYPSQCVCSLYIKTSFSLAAAKISNAGSTRDNERAYSRSTLR